VHSYALTLFKAFKCYCFPQETSKNLNSIFYTLAAQLTICYAHFKSTPSAS